MSLMSASLSGKLSHYWDMKTTNGETLNVGNFIPDRIGNANMLHTGMDTQLNKYGFASGLNGSGIQATGTTNNTSLVAPMWWQFFISSSYGKSAATHFGPGSGSFTISWWDYMESLPESEKDWVSLGNVLGYDVTKEHCLPTKLTPSGQIKAELHSGSHASPVDTIETSGLSPQMSGWNLWTIVADKQNNELSVYCNGSGESFTPVNSAVNTLTYPDTSYNGHIEWGLNLVSRQENHTHTNSVWGGVQNYIMDSCMIFHEALSSSEVLELYNSGSGVTLGTYSDEISQSEIYDSLQHYYTFDQYDSDNPIGSGDFLRDLKGEAHLALRSRTDSVADGSTSFQLENSGVIGSSTSGNQDADWHFVRNVWNGNTQTADPEFKVMGSGQPWSVSFWVKAGSIPTSTVYEGIVSVQNIDKSNIQRLGTPFTSRAGGNTLQAGKASNNSSPSLLSFKDDMTLDGTTWNHVLYSQDPKLGVRRVIVNGQSNLSSSQVATYTNNVQTAYPGLTPEDNYELALFTKLADYTSTGGAHQNEDFGIDEVAFFDTALDQRHAEVLYNGGSGLAYSGVYSQTPLTMGGSLSGKLSHFWDMETTNNQPLDYGNFVPDRIGSANMINTGFDGTATPYQPVSGLNGSGVEFTGSTSNNALAAPMQWYNTQGSNSFEKLYWGPGSGSFTVAWWDYQESYPASAKNSVCLGNVYGTQSSNELSFITNMESDGDLRVSLYQNAGSFIGNFTTSAMNPTLSGWKLWTIVVDKENPELTVYCNGSGQSLSTNASIANLNYPGKNNSESMGLNMFSYREDSSYTDSLFHAATNYKMDSCMVFDEALSAREVSGLYNGGRGLVMGSNLHVGGVSQDNVMDSLQHYYSFQDSYNQPSPVPSGGTLYDQKGNAHLTLEARTDSVADGSTSFSMEETGIRGTSTSPNQDPDWHFVRNIWNGTTQTADPEFNVMGSGQPFSVSYWFKGTINGNDDNDGIIGVTNKDKSVSSNDGHPFTERTQDFDDQLYTSITDAGGTNLANVEAGGVTLSATGWNHILVSYDPQTAGVRKIVNGQTVPSNGATNADYNENYIGRAYPGAQSDDDYELTLLSINNFISGSTGGIHQNSNNSIDEVAFFSAALDQRHAEVLYNGGSGYHIFQPSYMSAALSGKLCNHWDMVPEYNQNGYGVIAKTFDDFANPTISGHENVYLSDNMVYDRIGDKLPILNSSYPSAHSDSSTGLARLARIVPSGLQFGSGLKCVKPSSFTADIYHSIDFKKRDKYSGPSNTYGDWVPGTGDFTMVWWEYTSAVPTTGQYTLASFGSISSSARIFDFTMDMGSGVGGAPSGRLNINTYTGSTQYVHPSAGNTQYDVPVNSGWNMYAVAINKTTGQITAGVNGTWNEFYTEVGGVANGNVQLINTVGGISNVPYSLKLGVKYNLDNSWNYEIMDDLGGELIYGQINVFDSILSSSEVSELYYNGQGVILRPRQPRSLSSYDGDSVFSQKAVHRYTFDDTNGNAYASGALLQDQIGSFDLVLNDDPYDSFQASGTSVPVTTGLNGSGYGITDIPSGWRFSQLAHSGTVGPDGFQNGFNWFNEEVADGHSVTMWVSGNVSTSDEFHAYAQVLQLANKREAVYDISLFEIGMNKTGTDGNGNHIPYMAANVRNAGSYTNFRPVMFSMPSHYVWSEAIDASGSGWKMYSVTYDNRTQIFTSYINGWPVDRERYDVSSYNTPGQNISYTNSNYELSIGKNNFYSSADGYTSFLGKNPDGSSRGYTVDEIVLYSGTLNQPELRALYEQKVPSPNIASGSQSGDMGGYLQTDQFVRGAGSGSVGAYLEAEPLLANGSTSGSLGGYIHSSNLVSGFKSGDLGAYLESQPLVSIGSTTGSIGGLIETLPLAQGASSGNLGGYLHTSNVLSGSGSGSIGSYIYAHPPVASGANSGNLGGFVYTTNIVSGVRSANLGAFIEADPLLASGAFSESLGGYLHVDNISPPGSFSESIGVFMSTDTPKASGTLGGYISVAPLVVSGINSTASVGGYVDVVAPTSGFVGGYIVAIPETEASGVINISRPPVAVYSWDVSKLDPSGYRHIESGPYKPEAKGDLIGGFSSQNGQNTPLQIFSSQDLNLGSTTNGGTKALNVSLALPSGQTFASASAGEIQGGLNVYNLKMWLNDQSEASGMSPSLYYKKSSSWNQNESLTSSSSGVNPFPASEASGIDLGDITGVEGADGSTTDYVYLFVELPSGAYSPGVTGGSDNGYSIRISYDFGERDPE